MKKVRNFFYLIGQGFVGIFRNSVMTTASILVLICCMLVIGTFGLIVKVIQRNFEEIDDLNVIVAYLGDDVKDNTLSDVEKQIKALRNVVEVKYISKEDALERLKNQMGDSAELLEYYQNGINPLPNSFEITFDRAEEAHILLNSVEKLSGITKTSDKIDLVDTVSTITSGLLIIASIMMAVLLIVALFVIMNTIKLGVFARKSEIKIMRYVGATNSFIVMPFIVEGIIIGLFAAIIAFGIQFYLYDYVLSDIITSYGIGSMPPFTDYFMLV
ncbi:MAG: permease-like cell division protein FtsX, partial [Clostridia bacterium]